MPHNCSVKADNRLTFAALVNHSQFSIYAVMQYAALCRLQLTSDTLARIISHLGHREFEPVRDPVRFEGHSGTSEQIKRGRLEEGERRVAGRPQCRKAGVGRFIAAADAARVTRARARPAYLIRRRPQHRPRCRKGWWWARRGGRRCGQSDSRTRSTGTRACRLPQQRRSIRVIVLTRPVKLSSV
jgi:hypothetical protein